MSNPEVPTKERPQWALDEAYRIICERPWGWPESASDELTGEQEQHQIALADELVAILKQQLSTLTAENQELAQLIAENQRVKEENEELREKVKSLRAVKWCDDENWKAYEAEVRANERLRSQLTAAKGLAGALTAAANSFKGYSGCEVSPWLKESLEKSEAACRAALSALDAKGGMG